MDIILRFEDDHKQVNYKKFVDAVNWREHQIPSFHTIKLPPKVKPLYLSKRKVKTQHVRPLCNLGKCNMSTSSDKDYNGFQLFIFMLVFIFVSSCNIFFFSGGLELTRRSYTGKRKPVTHSCLGSTISL